MLLHAKLNPDISRKLIADAANDGHIHAVEIYTDKLKSTFSDYARSTINGKIRTAIARERRIRARKEKNEPSAQSERDMHGKLEADYPGMKKNREADLKALEKALQLHRRGRLDEKEILAALLRNVYNRSLEDTGKILGGLTRERTRQIESKGKRFFSLKKVRSQRH